MIEEPSYPFSFDSHREIAEEQYQKVRTEYQSFADEVKKVLSESLKRAGVKVHSIDARAKTVESFGQKASIPSPEDENKPKYPHPLTNITDLAGIRVITLFPETQEQVDCVISEEFHVKEKTDKTELLLKEEKFGYASIHYTCLPERKQNFTPRI